MPASAELRNNPELYSFLPLLYLVWSDAVLTQEETKLLADHINAQEWVKPDDKRLLLSFLDPGLPPSSDDVKSWLAEIGTVASSETETIVSIALALARKHGTSEDRLALIERSFAGIEKALGLTSREALTQLGISGTKTFTETQHTHRRFDIDRMGDILDGDQRELIDLVKAVISQKEFRPGVGLQMDTHRAQVLDWCRTLADMGLGAIAYPKEYGGAGDMAGYFTVMETLGYHDLSLVVKFGVQFGLFGMSIYYLGTEKHHRAYLKDIGTLALPGCFAMTETGHGSNVRGIETTATYDPGDGSFVIHTPNENARKEFIGNAALHGKMATVFAKLIIDKRDYGVNAFLVPLRDRDHQTLPGITIEDCGPKMGLNGVDNGLIRFDHVRIPRENMLDRYARVNDEGRFESPITSDNRRFFTMLGTLVGGRVGIPRCGLSAAKAGLAVAIRYGDKRRQFGPERAPEVPVLNYRTHQRRLMPLLANAYALHFALRYLTDRFMKRSQDDIQEIEALAAGLKSWATWNTTQTLQECREACGGKGYMSENRIDDLKNDTDVFTTFEGDNTVLLQLVAKSRLTDFRQEFSSMNLFGMVNYVTKQARTTLAEKNPFVVRNTDEEHLTDPEFHQNAFAWRERSVLTSAARRLKAFIDDGVDSFEAFNLCQDHLMQAALAYVERVVLEQFRKQVEHVPDEHCRRSLDKLVCLFALSQIEKNKGWYLENGYLEGVKTKAIRKLVDRLCSEVREEAVPLVDAFRIPGNCLPDIAK